VVKHFRSRIDHAKEMLDEGKQGDTLHGAIKEVLDLPAVGSRSPCIQPRGERDRELTNNAFYKFSGAKRRLAMYIPLLSAAFSRILRARDDAPYIVSLDEAFAALTRIMCATCSISWESWIRLHHELSQPVGRLRYRLVSLNLRACLPQGCIVRDLRALSWDGKDAQLMEISRELEAAGGVR